MTNVYFVIDTLTSGGAERVCCILANALSESYNVSIIVWRHLENFYELSPNVSLIYADEYGKNRLGKIRCLRDTIKKGVVIPFMANSYVISCIALAGKRHVKVIAAERNTPSIDIFSMRVKRVIALLFANYLVCQTEIIKNWFPVRIRRKAHIIVNPVTDDQIYLGKYNPSSKIILAVARTSPQKNYPMMIRAMARLHESHPEYILEIYGSRENEKQYAAKLHQLIGSLNAKDYIRIHGRVNDVNELYGNAYCFVQSSDYEGMSNSMLEALCSGIPVVSTKVSGAEDMIKDGYNGLLVDVGDENAFYNAIKRLVEDKTLAENISKNAWETRQRCSVEQIVQQWKDLIARC